jgi:16S rRNA A1518/A1519 N6-dimethyltransferase RsmA/KsgA/DIM1 with predicted DNA glycosylase/AP lyase activity
MLAHAAIDPESRPEMLSVQQFVTLLRTARER